MGGDYTAYAKFYFSSSKSHLCYSQNVTVQLRESQFFCLYEKPTSMVLCCSRSNTCCWSEGGCRSQFIFCVLSGTECCQHASYRPLQTMLQTRNMRQQKHTDLYPGGAEFELLARNYDFNILTQPLQTTPTLPPSWPRPLLPTFLHDHPTSRY